MPHVATSVRVAPTDTGICVRLGGRCVMGQSQSVLGVARRTLTGGSTVVLDLTDCTYMDSTCLGMLLELRHLGGGGAVQPPRFQVAGPAEVRKRLLGGPRLDRVVPARDDLPATVGDWVDVPVPAEEDRDLARHVMECHKHLAEIDSPMKDAFARIAAQMERELSSGAGVRA
jgi:hypothetical protein